MFWFLCKKFKNWDTLVYNGVNSVLKNVIDEGEARLWYSAIEKMKKKEVSIKKFWVEYIYNLPFVEDKWGNNITADLSYSWERQ